MDTKSVILDKAKEVVYDREVVHGIPENNLHRISTLWSGYLKQGVTPEDVAIMMIMLKCVRLRNDPSNIDSWVDIAGYAEIGCRCTTSDIESFYTKPKEWRETAEENDDIFS